MKNNVFLILFHNPWDWSADYPNQTAYQLAKYNDVFCFLLGDARSIKEWIFQQCTIQHQQTRQNPRLHMFTPLYIIPFRRFQMIVHINNWINIEMLKIWVTILRCVKKLRQRYVWLFYPGEYPLVSFFGASYALVYDCVDYFVGYKDPVDNELALQETRLIQKATYFFVNSHALYTVHRKIRKPTLVPQGFRIDEFQKPPTPISIKLPSDKPLIGYVGGINYRLDYDLLLSLIPRTPNFTYVFVGPIQENDPDYFQKHIRDRIQRLWSLPNVYHVDTLPKQDIPSVIALFDIAIIPYDSARTFNRLCYPMKLFEYFYLGKPVISTPIDELKRFPKYVKIGESAKEWENTIKEIVSKPWPVSFQKEQKRLALENSWEKKIAAISQSVT